MHRDRIENVFRVYNFLPTLTGEYFRLWSTFTLSSQWALCNEDSSSWVDTIDSGPEFSKEDLEARSNRFRSGKENIVTEARDRFSLMKQEDRMRVEFLYERGIPTHNIWLLYSDREVRYDTTPGPSKHTRKVPMIYRRGEADEQQLFMILGKATIISHADVNMISTKNIDDLASKQYKR